MMLLKNISFLESANYSAWPRRLVQLDKWQKRERTSNEIMDEYNNFWYRKALEAWENFSHLNQTPIPSRFFRVFDRMIYDEYIQNFEIYGVEKDEHLISINRDLFVANWSVVNALYENLLTDVIEMYVNKHNAFTLVELGCGTGNNLFNAHAKLAIDRIVGAEICSNAVKLGNQIAERCNVKGNFSEFDYYQLDGVANLLHDIKDKYIIFTSHSIEQIQLKKTNFVEQILELDHKPEVVIHLEPILDNEDKSLVHQLHQVYAQQNLYNSDLLEELLKHQKTGTIKIIDFKKDILGKGAFNPTSVLVWQCV